MGRKKIHYDINELADDVRCILDDHEYEVIAEKEISYGYQIKVSSGNIINIYVTGKIYVQGDEDQYLNNILKIRNLRF